MKREIEDNNFEPLKKHKNNMLKIIYNDKEIEVSSFKDFYENHFDKTLLNDEYTLVSETKLYNSDGKHSGYYHHPHLQSSLKDGYGEFTLRDGDIIYLLPLKIFEDGRFHRYST